MKVLFILKVRVKSLLHVPEQRVQCSAVHIELLVYGTLKKKGITATQVMLQKEQL